LNTILEYSTLTFSKNSYVIVKVRVLAGSANVIVGGMVFGLVFYFKEFENLRKAREKLSGYWKLVKIPIVVYEFKEPSGYYGMIVTPMNDGADPSAFLHAVESALERSASKLIDSMPKDVKYTNRWVLSETLDAFLL